MSGRAERHWFGSWSGVYRHGAAAADLVVTGTSISGTATLDTSGFGSGTGSVSGTISCAKLTLTITDPGDPFFETAFTSTTTGPVTTTDTMP